MKTMEKEARRRLSGEIREVLGVTDPVADAAVEVLAALLAGNAEPDSLRRIAGHIRDSRHTTRDHSRSPGNTSAGARRDTRFPEPNRDRSLQG